MSYYPYPTQVMVTPPRRSSTAHLAIAWTVAVVSALYMLPWAIAATRNKSNTGAIALLNLFLGWSIVGWIVALIMSCSAENNQPQVVVLNGHGLPAYPVWGHPQADPQHHVDPHYVDPYHVDPYRQQQSALLAPYPAALPSSYPTSATTAPYLTDPYPTSPTTAPYPHSPTTAPHPNRPTTASEKQTWGRPVAMVSTETVPLDPRGSYPDDAVEITHVLPAPSDPSGDGHGRQ